MLEDWIAENLGKALLIGMGATILIAILAFYLAPSSPS